MVLFLQNYRVFPLGYFQIAFRGMQAHYVGFGAVQGAGRVSITVNGNEEIGLFAVSQLGPVAQRYEYVGSTGVVNLYVREVFFDGSTHFESHLEGDFGFFGSGAVATGVFTPVAGIDYYRSKLVSRANRLQRGWSGSWGSYSGGRRGREGKEGRDEKKEK